jgi:hypothetical protein
VTECDKPTCVKACDGGGGGCELDAAGCPVAAGGGAPELPMTGGSPLAASVAWLGALLTLLGLLVLDASGRCRAGGRLLQLAGGARRWLR